LLQSCAAWEFRGELTFGSEFHKVKNKNERIVARLVKKKKKTGFYIKYIEKEEEEEERITSKQTLD
jgi:hypothetical protein